MKKMSAMGGSAHGGKKKIIVISLTMLLFGILFGGTCSAQTGTVTCDSGYTQKGGVCFPSQTGLASTSVQVVLTTILYWLLGIFGSIAIIAFAISGIQYLLSAGNETMIETAKRNMVWSIVGVVVALSGLIIIYAVNSALSGNAMF